MRPAVFAGAPAKMRCGRRLIARGDDASRLIAAFRAVGEATTSGAMDVLHEGMARHCRPASVMTGEIGMIIWRWLGTEGVMPAKSPSESRWMERRQGSSLGASMLQISTGGRTIHLTSNPCATGGGCIIQLVDGRVSRVVTLRAGAGMVPGPRPARRGGLRACNQSNGTDLTVRTRRPVFTRKGDGGDEIVYRTSEMDEGKLYTIEWDGDHYALRKSGRNVEIFKFRPDGDGD